MHSALVEQNLMDQVTHLGGVSGGNWFNTQLMFSKSFHAAITDTSWPLDGYMQTMVEAYYKVASNYTFEKGAIKNQRREDGCLDINPIEEFLQTALFKDYFHWCEWRLRCGHVTRFVRSLRCPSLDRVCALARVGAVLQRVCMYVCPRSARLAQTTLRSVTLIRPAYRWMYYVGQILEANGVPDVTTSSFVNTPPLLPKISSVVAGMTLPPDVWTDYDKHKKRHHQSELVVRSNGKSERFADGWGKGLPLAHVCAPPYARSFTRPKMPPSILLRARRWHTSVTRTRVTRSQMRARASSAGCTTRITRN